MALSELAAKLPYPLKQSLKYVYGTLPFSMRYGKVFRDTYAFLQESQWWSREKLEEYQLQRLSQLLQHAYENVPYYRKVFNERGLKPRDIQNKDDLLKLPYLTKDIIQEHLAELVAKNRPLRKRQYVTTGGSTGIPLGFYHERGVSEAKEWAFMHTLWNRVGFRIGNRNAIIRATVVSSTAQGKYWGYDPVWKSLLLSSYHMTDDNLPGYIQKLREFKPDFIQAYPSAITILAKFMVDHKIQPFPSIKAILCGSENIYDWQRELLQNALQCRVYSWYGHAEQAVLAGECEKSSYYHIFPEYGITELINGDGKSVTEENGLGEVVATGLYNYVCPLIRYRTMDLAVRSNSTCECGRSYPLLKRVEGRLQEFIVTGTGRLVSMVAINMHSNIFDNIRQFQFYQDKKGEVVFNIVKKETYTDKDSEYIRKELSKKLGDDVNLGLHFVDNIPRTKSGKYRFLIQKLPVAFGD